MLDRYVDFLETKDYKLLVKEGNPPPEALHDAALDLISQFQETIGNIHSKQHKRIVADLQQMDVRINRIMSVVTCLRVRYCQELIEELKADGFSLSGEPDNLSGELDRVETLLKNEVVRRNVKKKQLEEFHEQHSGKTSTRADFIKTLQVVSGMDGVHYRIKEVTVEEYCVLVNRLIEQANKSRK